MTHSGLHIFEAYNLTGLTSVYSLEGVATVKIINKLPPPQAPCVPYNVSLLLDFTRPQVPHLFSGDANALCIGFTVLLAEGLTQNDVYGHL